MMASKTKKDHIFTDDEKKFLIEYIDKYTYRQLAKAFNTKFGTTLSHGNISDVCIKRLGIKRNKQYSFPFGKKDYNALPIGSEVFDGKVVWLKIDNKYHKGTAINKSYDENWVRKHVWIYEQKHGKIPDNRLVIFLDHNNRNCSPDNLYCTTRKINFMMAKNKWYRHDRELTLTAIKWCELYYALVFYTRFANFE